jgi:hypothetical protein
VSGGSTADARPRGRGRAVLVVVAAGGVVLGLAVPAWLQATGSTALSPHVAVAVSGSQASQAVGAAGLVLLAAGGALSLVGRVSRWVVVAVVVAVGVLVAVSAVGVVLDPMPIAESAVAEKTGAGVLSGDVRVTVFPYLACATGVVVVLIGGWLARSSARWVTSSRHEVAPRSVPDDDHSAWDALTRGDDPS